MSRPLRILVIEDSEDDVLLLMRELKLSGYNPLFERVDTPEALRKALAHSWDIIISDYIMPRFSGLAALDIVKEYRVDTPFIIVSGKIGEDTAVEAMKAGAHDYIVKGNLARLIPAVQRELREAETRRERKRAEKALKESEDRLRAIAATAIDAIIIMDNKGEIAYWNRAAENIFGYTEQEALGESLHLFIAPEKFHGYFEKGFHKFIKTGKGPAVGNTIEFIALRKDGSEFPVEVSLSSIQVKNHWHAVGIIRDITERKRAEAELMRHRDHLEELVEERTSELKKTNTQLEHEIAWRRRIEEELKEHRDHLDLLVKERTAELLKVNRDLRAEIMRRIQMEKELMESQRFVNRLTDATPNILYLHDVIDNRTLYVNLRVQDMLGYTPEEVKKTAGVFFLRPDDHGLSEYSARHLTNAVEGSIIETEYRLKNSKGEWRWLSSRDVVFKMSADGKPRLILGMAQDVTERKEAEEEIKNSREQLRKLLAHLQTVREDERTRISREIHDELGQSLTALKMDVSWIMKRLGKNQKDLRDKTELMLKLIDINIQTVKRISAELRPGLLDHLGLAAALEWQAEEFQNRTGIECELTLRHEDIALDREITTAIFRIFQETITNVVRHAEATRIRVLLKTEEGVLTLQVRDNGTGITKKQAASPKSIGLIGMKERIHFLGGQIKISGVRNRGTTVTVSIPIDA